MYFLSVVEDLGDLEPSLEHPLTVSELVEKANDTAEQVEDEKEPASPLKRQDSVKKSTKTPESSVPQTPTETDSTQSPFKRQDSFRKTKRSSDTSAPQTPTETSEKPPKLLRQDSKKSKASDSAPETPTEVPDKRPKLSRQDSKKSNTSAPETPVESSEKPPKFSKQDSKKSEPSTPTEVTEPKLVRQDSKKSKASDTSAPETPVESSEKPPPLSRQESKKSQPSAPQTPVESKEPQLVRQDSEKSKASDTSVPQTPTDTTAPTLTRQGSVKKKQKKQSSTEKEPVAISEEKEVPPLERQESVSKKTTTVDKKKADVEEEKTTELRRQDSQNKKEAEDKKKPKQGEETVGVPTIIMNEEASGSDARMESVEFGDDSATVASESFRSDSMTPPGSDFDPMDKPRFAKTLRGVTCTLGETAVLECETDGSPEPSVTWLRDNQKIVKSKRVTTSSAGQKHSLTIKDACADDGGLYTVVATSSKGSASCSAPLNLKLSLLGLPKEDSRPTTPGGTVLPHAPVFKVKLNKETQLLEGTSVRFELVVRGNPEPEVKFLKDGKVLKLDDRVRVVYENKEVFELILDHVVAKDAGTYTVIATNAEGEDKTVGNLSVVKHKDVFKGLEVEEVEREPTPRPKTPKFRWFKNGEFFEANERFQVIFNEEEDSLALMFQHVTPEDAGLYTCVASTSTGSKIACSAELTVQGVIRQVEAPSIKAELSDAEATEGGSAMLELKINGYPKPKVTWYHRGKEVSTGGRIRFLFADEETFTLVIKNVKKDDGGKYSVKATNEMGEAESSCNLTVKTAPSFLKGLKDMSVMAEEVLKLEVEIEGNPAPEIKWYKDGQPLSPGGRIKVVDNKGKQRLEIANAKPTDSGSYSCVITNDLGNQAEFSNVVVKASPTFTKGMENVEGLEGDTLKFNVEINGNPKPTLKWLKDGKELPMDGQRIKVTEDESNSYTLTIQNATPADVGVYTCELRNEHGLKASSGNLNIKSLDEKYLMPIGDQFIDFDKFKKTGIPVPLSERPKIVRMDDTSLTLGWKPSVPTCPRVPVTYQLEMAKHPDGEWTPYKTGLKDTLCDVRDLRPGQDYKFQIRVENKHGISDPSPYVTAHRSKIYQPPSPADFKPKDYSLEHPPFTKYAAPPKFVRKEEDVMYGVRGHPVTIEFWVYGQPEPQVTWFKGESQIGKDKYGFMQDRNGKLCVFIDCMNDDYVGTYTCVAVNDEGEATMKIKLLIAEPPIFIERLDETTAMSRRSARMQCRVTGLPYPKIKWFRDWHPLYESERIKILWEEPDKCTLYISNLITRDNALYSCTATNIAGTATSSASLNVEGMLLSSLSVLAMDKFHFKDLFYTF
ncbi:obscurin [Nephila pilipes]|uniref:Obscurin n=1 Tax=Nephila pilipes TaxID=299642 RepID=A0A8X6NT17_NEPPI|nr:obscurin [Nephila pilipes]